MARKSVYMLKSGMTVVIDGKQRQITDVERVSDVNGLWVVITCGDDVYRRSPGTKIDVISCGKY